MERPGAGFSDRCQAAARERRRRDAPAARRGATATGCGRGCGGMLGAGSAQLKLLGGAVVGRAECDSVWWRLSPGIARRTCRAGFLRSWWRSRCHLRRLSGVASVAVGGGQRADVGEAVARVEGALDIGRPGVAADACRREGLVIVLLGVVTGGLFLLVEFLWPLGESSHRALHDLWSGIRGERALNRARPVSGTLSVVDEFRRGWRSLSAPVLQPLMSAHAAARST